MGRFVSRRPLPRGPRRQTSWTVGVGGGVLTAFSGTGNQFFGSAIGPFGDGTTIVRIRGFIELILNTAVALGDGYTGAMGIGIVQTRAFTAGIGSMPNPEADDHWEGWMWHQYVHLHAPTAAQLSENRQIFEVDSKAMRKIGADMTLVGLISLTEVGDATLSAYLNSRVLVKLP